MRRAGLRLPRWALTGLALAGAGLAGLVLSGCGEGAPGVVRVAQVGSLASARMAAGNPVAVSPQPGTPDASPRTQISFLGPPGTRVVEVKAVGSRSGAHGGRIEGYSTGTGASFLPERPFVAGERVGVVARVEVPGGSSASGTAAGVVARTSFTVAREVPVSQAGFPRSPGDPGAVQHYRSAPGLTPSTVQITTPARPGGASGDLFLAPYQGRGSAGPMIAEQDGSLVWFHPLPAGEVATNFEVQEYGGRPVLTWWQGRVLQVGFGVGEDVIYDDSYRRVAMVRAGNGYHADLHEIRVTPQGTAWIDVFEPIRTSLAEVHGSSRAVLLDAVVQEIDVRTGLVMWEWHALGHVALSESNDPLPPASYPWDYIHVNSVDPGGEGGGTGPGEGASAPGVPGGAHWPGPAGQVLLSARNTWALYDVDIHTGAILWRLGGRRSSFALGAGTRTYWQHDAEWRSGGLISVFDNGTDPPKEPQTRGVLLRPDLANHTVSLARAFVNPSRRLLASSQGNVLALPGGRWLMGYGGLPDFTEYGPSGEVLLDGTLGREVQSFRTYLAPWSGQPGTPPALAAQRVGGGGVEVEASWNGATDVASWQVLVGARGAGAPGAGTPGAGAAPGALTPVATVPRRGFETTIHLSGAAAAGARAARAEIVVRALDSAGRTLATSLPAHPS